MNLVWHRARCESGLCVEVAYVAACSSATNCVEVGAVDGEVLIRDSKDPAGPVIRLTRDEWRRLRAYDWSAGPRDLVGVGGRDGGDGWRWCHAGASLCFTDAELRAFLAGLTSGEFDHLMPAEVTS